MKNLMGGLALAVMLFSMPATQAEIVLDNFQGSGEGTFNNFGPAQNHALDDDVSGTRDTTFGGGGFIQVTYGSSLAVVSNSIGSVLNITYNLDAPLDLHSSGAFPGSPLLLDLFDSVAGSFDLVVSYSSSTTGETASFDTIAINSAGPIGIDGTDLGNGALASTVDTIDLQFTVTSLDGASTARFDATNGSIAAVPEPASLALLGMTGLGAVALRRRKNQREA